MSTVTYYQPARNGENKQKRSLLGITRGQALLILLLIGMLFLLIGGVLTPEVKADQTTYKIITVQQGDNLWNLAKQSAPPEADIRDVVDEIMELNHLSDPIIYPGQSLQLPLSP